MSQVGDEIMRADRFRGRDHLLFAGIQFSIANILRYGTSEKEGILQDDAHLAAQTVLGHLAQIIAVDRYAPAWDRGSG